MRQQREEEVEYDVYYRGTKQELFAFLYPLTGPQSSLFNHLEMKKTAFDPEKKNFEVKYEPKDFQNIDKQKEEIIYKSTTLPTQSNYFYSVFQPEYNLFVWQSIDNFVEMRPQSKSLSSPQKEEKGESQENKSKLQLELVEYQNTDNKVRDMIEDVVTTPIKENWEVSKDEYLTFLAK